MRAVGPYALPFAASDEAGWQSDPTREAPGPSMRDLALPI